MCRRYGRAALRGSLELADVRTAFLSQVMLRKRESPMAFEDLKAEISVLLTRMQNEPEDAHELHLQLQEKLNELRAYGLPIPEDLSKLEAALSSDLDESSRPV